MNVLIRNHNSNIQEIMRKIYQCGEIKIDLPEIQKDYGTKFEPSTAQLSTGPVQLTSASQHQPTEANQLG